MFICFWLEWTMKELSIHLLLYYARFSSCSCISDFWRQLLWNRCHWLCNMYLWLVWLILFPWMIIWCKYCSTLRHTVTDNLISTLIWWDFILFLFTFINAIILRSCLLWQLHRCSRMTLRPEPVISSACMKITPWLGFTHWGIFEFIDFLLVVWRLIVSYISELAGLSWEDQSDLILIKLTHLHLIWYHLLSTYLWTWIVVLVFVVYILLLDLGCYSRSFFITLIFSWFWHLHYLCNWRRTFGLWCPIGTILTKNQFHFGFDLLSNFQFYLVVDGFWLCCLAIQIDNFSIGSGRILWSTSSSHAFNKAMILFLTLHKVIMLQLHTFFEVIRRLI